MLLTLTTTHVPATDLGFLLHKHPERLQRVELPFGAAHVFYPEATAERCTAALLLDVDPIALVRGRRGGEGGMLDQYVNDRPYAASSLLGVALRRVFGTALGGRCEQRPELAAVAIPLAARLMPLRCRGGLAVARALFEPLGYALAAERIGEGAYWDVTLTAETTLSRLLTHLYVLIPVLDDEKHYWVGEDEIEKLLRHGEGWLQLHPERELIARRYLKHQGRLARAALARLEAADESAPDAEPDAEPAAAAPARRLNDERLERVAAVIKAAGARSVLDLGCGTGKLLALLLRDRQLERIVGLDIASRDLAIAAERLHLAEMSEAQRRRIELRHGALTYRDRRLAGFDAAALVEVIEHVDPSRLGALADAVFGVARPRLVVLTTPNAEYNARYPALAEGGLRHDDHRFEWSRAEFRAWAERVAGQFGYAVAFEGIGEADPELGAPTQMGLFTCS
jgi:3' terminal RNA ribose 2'-O-methyltransferase Hen1